MKPHVGIPMGSHFEKELEFVQLLANPDYIKWLYTEGYFNDGSFVEYLKYLTYFKEPKYIQCLLYPQCIPILEILCLPNIKEKLKDDMFYTKLSESLYYTWKNRWND